MMVCPRLNPNVSSSNVFQNKFNDDLSKHTQPILRKTLKVADDPLITSINVRVSRWPGHGEEGGELTKPALQTMASASPQPTLPYMGIDLRHCLLSSPECTDSHGPALLIGQSTNTINAWLVDHDSGSLNVEKNLALLFSVLKLASSIIFSYCFPTEIHFEW